MKKYIWKNKNKNGFITECAKKPIPDLGPEYFSLYLWGVGWIPYACHGDRIYSDLLCGCVPVPGIVSLTLPAIFAPKPFHSCVSEMDSLPSLNLDTSIAAYRGLSQNQ